MADYLYYKKNYKGNIINDREDFARSAALAERYIASVADGYAGCEAAEDCICAVAEQLFENGSLRGVKSETADGCGVTYSESFKKHLYGVLRLYLPSELLYRGF